MNKKFLKTFIIFVILFTGVYMSFNYFGKPSMKEYNMSYTRFLNIVNNDGIFKVRLEKNVAHVLAKNGDEFSVDIPDNDTTLIDSLYAHKADIVIVPPTGRNIFFEILKSMFNY